MIEIEFPRYFTLVCNNSSCPLFRERQGVREKQVGLGSAFMPSPLPNPHPSQKRKIKEENRIEGNRRGYKKRLQKSVTMSYKNER